jgi:hypothetical protein
MNKSDFLLLLRGNVTKSNLYDLEAFIFAFCLFLLAPPFYLWNTISPLFFIVICSFLALKNVNVKNKNNIGFFIAFILIYGYFAFRNDFNIFGLLTYMGICTLSIISGEFPKKVLHIFIYLFSITLIPSIIVFILVYFFGLNFHFSIIEPLNQLRETEYVKYPFLVQENMYESMFLPRFYGYYDEPGVIGTVSGVLLLCQGFNLKKWINIPIFIAGLLSFSFAFIITTLVYGFIFVKTKYKILIGAVTIVIVLLFSGNEVLDTYIFNRFELENGKLAGDRRVADDFETYYQKFSETTDYYFGQGQKVSLDINYGGATYKDLIVSYGIVAFIIFITLFLLMAYTEFQFRKEFFLYLFILFSVLYQRPFIGSFLYMFLLFAPLSFLNKTTTNENNSFDS